MLTRIPSGLREIIATFGELDDRHFEEKNIVTIEAVYPLLYAGKPVSRLRCHKLAAENFTEAFRKVQKLGLEGQFKEFNGLYARRAIRGMPSHPSTHSWGIAIDMEAFDPNVGDKDTHPLGSKRRLPDAIVNAFAQCGFEYGGDFRSRPDPMHLQLCRNY